MRTIPVRTESAEYKVYVGPGLLAGLRGRLQRVSGRRGALPRLFLLTSEPIWALWGVRFAASFGAGELTVLFLPPGEKEKRLRSVERLLEEMAAAGADRASWLVAFGGGIVGDVGGFLAAIYMRGIPFVQVPTTLLAQVDSSVGGKTGVNLAAGKNLVGSFHQPLAVFADIDVLGTLPARELRAGLFESLKAGVIRDLPLFRLLEGTTPEGLAGDRTLLERVVARSVAIKAAVVGEDEREGGVRMILNLGHTVGHAIEAVTRYRVLLHGEAVGWGMLAALAIAERRGTMTGSEAQRVARAIAGLGPLPPFRASVEELFRACGSDKKNRGGVRRFVLPKGIGDAIVVEDVTDAELRGGIEAMLAQGKAAARG